MIQNNLIHKKSNIRFDSNIPVKRYERKYEISYWVTNSIKGLLLSKGFKKQFPIELLIVYIMKINFLVALVQL